MEKENVEKENVEKENVEKENVEKENVEKENVEKENVEKENVETAALGCLAGAARAPFDHQCYTPLPVPSFSPQPPYVILKA